MTAEVEVTQPFCAKLEPLTPAKMEAAEHFPITPEEPSIAKVDVTQPISINTELPPICTGSKFSSFAEFETAFELWKRTYCHAFRVASSETLRQPDGTVYETFKYRYIVYHCAHYGKPRMRGIGKRPNQNYLPCGCRAMLRLNFNYADNALRITTLNDVHTGHEVSPESFARISAKCRRISPDSGGSGGASPSPFSGSSSCASSKSTNPSPRTCFLPSRAHTHSGSEKTSPASQNEAERNALGSLCENDAPASAGRIPLFSGMPLMQTLKEELLRAYLSPAMSYNAVPNIHPQRSFPSQMPHVDQQRLFEFNEKQSNPNGAHTNLQGGALRNGLSAAALGLLELQQRQLNATSIFGNIRGNALTAGLPPAAPSHQSAEKLATMKVLNELLSNQSSLFPAATHGALSSFNSYSSQPSLGSHAKGYDLGGDSVQRSASQQHSVVEALSPTKASDAVAEANSTTNAGGHPQDFKELINQINKIPTEGTNAELIRYFKRQTQMFLFSKLVKRVGSTELFLSSEFQNFVLSLTPEFQMPSAEELQTVLTKAMP